MSKSTAQYSRIPNENWSYTEWINQTKASENRELSAQKHIIYRTVRQSTKEYPDLIPKDNARKWITNNDSKTYNLCNFEIGDLTLFPY
nr:8821_t:CDS:2 [Entrophospora candida]